MKKILFAFFILTLILSNFSFILARLPTAEAAGFGGQAQEKPQVEIKFFYSRTCPYCAKENEFLDNLEQKYPELIINRYDISSRENINLLENLYQEYEVPRQNWGLVPITFTEEKYFLGFNDNIAKNLESCIEECIFGNNGGEDDQGINLPFIGQIDPGKYSLPVLTVIMGVLDGFNICSLGALVLILGLVLTLRSRKKVLFFGSIFILTTAAVYGILIFLWYQLFSLLAPYVRIMELLIGALGIGGAIYFFKQFTRYRKYGPACDAQSGQKIGSKFSQKLKDGLENKKVLAVVGLIFLFAAIITIVEFPCSAAIPVIFAGILSKSHLPALLYLVYIVAYLVFYMLDEIIVFLVAAFKMSIWITSGKFMVWINLIEAVALFLLGGYYLISFF